MPDNKNTVLPKVAVVTVHDGGKSYADFLFPGNYKIIDYANKIHIHITPDNCPALANLSSGEMVATIGRQAGIDEAKRLGVDYIFFLDYDTMPDPDCVKKLLELGVPLVGGLHCARGNEFMAIGHNYKDRVSKERLPLGRYDLVQPMHVDGISGGTLLVAKEIFNEVDYSGYTGPDVIPGRHTMDDEYLQIQIYNKLAIRPMVHPEVKSFHYSEDGYYYRCWGIKKLWRK